MGLKKEITLGNGVSVNYHRIVSINNITNVSTIIEVASYTSEEKRKEEKTAIENAEPMNIYIDTDYINKEYEENLKEYVNKVGAENGENNRKRRI